ncbi:GH116 family glycosyl-hydrolase [Antribacter gilvus]|uniref:GH116 family glycosyl-hydrolase n=1 Tax=Antribacter gilvus TaxID=2304675 RepID=UPI000F773CCB|nr:GH116 family glycosyl-hydrolase [Antribacter gilvus]
MAAVLDASASAAAFPLGGIGTGNVSVGARGELRDWELANRPAKGAKNPFSFFTVRAESDGAAPVTRVLEARHRPPHEADQGYYAGDVAGLPRLAGTRVRGRYPMLELDFVDADLPVEVSLTAFTPFVPLDEDDSGIPCAVLRYTVHNPGADVVRVALAGSLANPVGAEAGRDVFHFPTFSGRPRNAWREEDGVRGLFLTSDLPGDHLLAGTVALTTAAPHHQVSAKPTWLYGAWQDGVQRFWDEFRDTGTLTPEDVPSLDPEPHPAWMTRLRVGSLSLAAEIAPGESADFEFRLTWHFPNRPRGWAGNIVLDDPYLDQVVRNAYARRYDDAWAVAVDLDRRLDGLEATTRAFTTALYESTLPEPVLDAVGSNLAVIRSSTCFRLEDGTFAAWEGSFDQAGSCEGTCTHVWTYAQSMAWLFPALERSARRTELLIETRHDGHMNFRTNQIFGSPAWDFHPAADGQLGTVLRVYREWLLSGDDDFVREVWPSLVSAVEFAFRQWDSDGDLVLDGKQHNTYDIEFVGADARAGSIFYAALRAGAELADRLGDAGLATRWRESATVGAARMDALLFNGEYYQQDVEDVDAERYQFGTGVLSDQLLGQLLAHVVGLGHLFPPEHVRSAVRAVHAHNFRPSLLRHESVQRTYALGDEAGLVLCSWPRGGRPRIPFVYADEVWTGVEYQVAAHLAFEGLLDESLEIVTAVRARHDGHRRSPWNEVECGNHYARSLASWALLLAWSGVRTSVADRVVTVDPAVGGKDLRTLFSTGTAWGRLELDDDGLRLHVDGGSLHVDRAVVGGVELVAAPSGPGDAVPAGPARPGDTLSFTTSPLG